MSHRYRLYPTPAQEQQLLEHCAHARFVWNLVVEQQTWWQPGRGKVPGYLDQNRQLTEARAVEPWLASGSRIVQRQALRDYERAIKAFFRSERGKPTWRKRHDSESFTIECADSSHVQRLSAKVSQVRVPKIGWVRFKQERPLPVGTKSYHVKQDRTGQWHVSFTAIPTVVPFPDNGSTIGIDRGVAVSAALSTGELCYAPQLSPREQRRCLLLQRQLARSHCGSKRREKTRLNLARLKRRERDRRKDWVEKLTTRLAREHDVIVLEDLKIKSMIRSARGTAEKPGKNAKQKAGLNRGILANGWGLLNRRLEDKAPGRVIKVPPHYTSQRCFSCKHVDRESRESQAVFRCTACGHNENADVNAAKNIAAGYVVTARGGPQIRAVEARTNSAVETWRLESQV